MTRIRSAFVGHTRVVGGTHKRRCSQRSSDAPVPMSEVPQNVLDMAALTAAGQHFDRAMVFSGSI